MAISETTLKDTVLMMVDDINKRQGRGGVRLLDLGVAQIGPAGVRGAERPA